MIVLWSTLWLTPRSFENLLEINRWVHLFMMFMDSKSSFPTLRILEQQSHALLYKKKTFIIMNYNSGILGRRKFFSEGIGKIWRNNKMRNWSWKLLDGHPNRPLPILIAFAWGPTVCRCSKNNFLFFILSLNLLNVIQFHVFPQK